jgi:hypothetical protein
LGLFAAQSPLDSTAHVLLPAAATSLLYDAIYHRVVHSAAQYFCTMVLLGVSTEMIWEVLEFGGDAAFGLTWQVDNADNMNDIICGIVGACVGAGIRLWIWLGSRRAAPAHPLPALPQPRSPPGRRKGRAGGRRSSRAAPPGYLGYLAWAMPHLRQAPRPHRPVDHAGARRPHEPRGRSLPARRPWPRRSPPRRRPWRRPGRWCERAEPTVGT